MIRCVTAKNGDVYMTVELDNDKVILTFKRGSARNLPIHFDRKAVPQLIEIFREIKGVPE